MNKLLDYQQLLDDYKNFINQKFEDRYISFDDFEQALENDIFKNFEHQILGYSEQHRSIYSIEIGRGKTKILIWSQMHGNESTTTKAIFDFFNFIVQEKSSDLVQKLLMTCHIQIIPMLNPDGATNYTRLNANDFDLNRDAILKSQKETRVFFENFYKFKPDFCFNMHGQRTIFSAGKVKYPATISFLAPSADDELSINPTRLKAIKLISATSEMLQNFMPNQIGRYDDAHNLNCFGDYIQNYGVPTILFEAGHFADDYNRNETRKYVLISFLKMIECIVNNSIDLYSEKTYFKIPLNEKLYLDCIIKNVKNSKSGYIGIQFKEVLKGKYIVFQPYVNSLDDLSEFFAHREIDAQHQDVKVNGLKILKNEIHIDDLQIGGELVEFRFS